MNDAVSYLRCLSSDPKTVALLEQFGVRTVPKLKRGDDTSIVQNRDAGIEITFRDARTIPAHVGTFPKGALVLSNIRLYGEGDKTLRPYAGVLPHSLTLSDSLRTATEKLGREPNILNQTFSRGRWDLPDHWLFVTFADDFERMRQLAVQIPA